MDSLLQPAYQSAGGLANQELTALPNLLTLAFNSMTVTFCINLGPSAVPVDRTGEKVITARGAIQESIESVVTE